jgi:hypothetical protein
MGSQLPGILDRPRLPRCLVGQRDRLKILDVRVVAIARTNTGAPGAGVEGFGIGLCSPRRDRTSLRNSSQERNFLLQRPGGEMGSFTSIAGAETALAREFGRHVFEIAAIFL